MLKLPREGAARPLYQQIKDQILSRIRSDEWQSGTRIPSENELVDQLGVSRMTVHRALRELTQEGFLERVHGLGTFVAKPRRHASLITLRDIAEEVSASGSTHQSQVLKLRTISANRKAAHRMEVEPGTTLYHLQALHTQDDVAIQYENRLVNPAAAPAFIDQDFGSATATEYLISQLRPEQMEHEVRAIHPTNRIARLLMIEPTQPCLALDRRTWSNDRIVTSVTMIYPGNRYSLSERYSTS